jgi:5-methylcytosine-specific restriction endonuclease McrA
LNKTKSYYQENKEECLQNMREWQSNNQEHLREYRREYNKRNKLKKDEQSKIYYQQNKKYYNNYYSIKYHNEDKFNLTKRMYSIIRQAILKNKSGWNWESYVGYTTQELINHLKTTLPEGYSWNDYLEGKLELDHIIPISAFDFSKPTDYEFQECWDLNNLRLITPKDNHEKGSKILQAEYFPAVKIG